MYDTHMRDFNCAVTRGKIINFSAFLIHEKFNKRFFERYGELVLVSNNGSE
jgi:hypothetical protein